jgi:hypothetical protein
MKEYFTTWILSLFILKYIFQYVNIDVSEYINLYYLSIVLLYGYILFMIVDMNIKNNQYNIYVYTVNAIIHMLPLFILCLSGKIKTEYAFETALCLFIPYVIYLSYKNTDMVSVYVDDRERIRGNNF